jgi:hypothetical protein
MSDEKLRFQCGNCAWYNAVIIPEDKKDKVSPRGMCHAAPPSVFPVPRMQQSKLALAQGTKAPGVQMVPQMFRPVVEEDEDICGSYQPTMAMKQQLSRIDDQAKAGCGGCTSKDGVCKCQ